MNQPDTEPKVGVMTVETIDMRMSWEGILTSLLLIYTDSSSSDDRRHAYSEMRRMAHLADLYVAEHKDDDRPSGS
jgi:hypothetical protein